MTVAAKELDPFDDFWAALRWQPIGSYDRVTAANVILRGVNGEWCTGWWGAADEWTVDESRSATWRDSQESMDGVSISFEPVEFAIASEDWLAALVAD